MLLRGLILDVPAGEDEVADVVAPYPECGGGGAKENGEERESVEGDSSELLQSSGDSNAIGVRTCIIEMSTPCCGSEED